MANKQQNYYTNPAFCQQSEYYAHIRTSPRGRALSPERRQNPLGANKPIGNEVYYQPTQSPPKIGPKPQPVQRKPSVRSHYNNNERYEEMLVDDRPEKTRKIDQNDNQKYLEVSNGNVKQQVYKYNGNEQIEYEQDNRPIVMNTNKGRYAVVPTNEEGMHHVPKHRYEYIPMQVSPRKQLQKPKIQPDEEEMEVVQGRLHRYSVIPSDEEIETPLQQNRYALVPVTAVPQNSRYAVVPNGRYDYIPDEYEEPIPRHAPYYHSSPNATIRSPQTPRKANLVATQKLHELLTTPKKTPQKILSPPSQRRLLSPQPGDPFFTPNKTPAKVTRLQTPKAQQKLNYTLSTRQPNIQENKRHTAVINPICSSPVQSVYSETTFSNKTESWMNLSIQKPPIQATLAIAAIMMTMCGSLTSGLCFYMVSVVGRMYYLDFGIVSGFACLLLGLLGFRSRNCHWLPNRNYISGYIVLSAFSLLTCAGLLVLLFLQPKPGSPLADVTSGAVCGISGLSLILASAGVIASYCCKYPPPDNRVQHCVQGFVV